MPENDKPNGPAKSFMTAGPTLHYRHRNVRRCWLLATAVYFVTCLFWSKILTGTALQLGLSGLADSNSWYLGRFIISPLSIYEYPWQIFVLGVVMGIIAVVPVLVSQLLSFRYSLVMILCAVFIANLPLFAGFVLISALAVACRPLRFRSRFIAIALCMTPQLIYWAFFGSCRSVDPIRWGFSFGPWICAWLTGLAIAGAVIGIGHYTRYRPGLIWSICGLFLALALLAFQSNISFAELDYQLYIAGNNPEELRQFHDHDMTDVIDDAIRHPGTKRFLDGLFYPTEPILLRERLKAEIQRQLGYDRWPKWFNIPYELNYQAKRQWLLDQYAIFINKRSTSKRMPTALYYKAMLNEYSPDILLFGQTEVLRFYTDYPHHETLPIWYQLYDEFPQSPEALEARRRVAMHMAGQGKFEKATELCEVAAILLEMRLKLSARKKTAESTLLTVFASPAETVMTEFKLRDLLGKLNRLKLLVGPQNHSNDEACKKRLARFVILNPHRMDYAGKLNELLAETTENDPLRDNIMLARIMLIADSQLRSRQLEDMSEKFPDTDGGLQALYELGMLKVQLWKDPQTSPQDKNVHLANARKILTDFTSRYPKSIFSSQARKMLASLPETK